MKSPSLRRLAGLLILLVTSLLGACTSFPEWLASPGPTRREIERPSQTEFPIPVLEVNEHLARRLLEFRKRVTFSEVWSADHKPIYRVGAGDVLEVTVWEAPPVTLFGGVAIDPRTGATTSRGITFPEQIVEADGMINIPFAGPVRVVGKSPFAIEAEIARLLSRVSHQPQVLVRITRNVTSNTTVVGEVGASVRMPLTAKGERVLDAIAAAGGSRQPVGKTTIQITRAGRVLAMPLDMIIQDPAQNIRLQPDDVVTALYQPLSFTVLGASGKNEEVMFEAQGISLAQALARSGGLQDTRADARGIFLFRFEDPALFESESSWPRTADGKIPVVYRIDLKDPRSFLVAQNFPMQNKDVLYVANARSAELQKFLNILSSSIFSISGLVNVSR